MHSPIDGFVSKVNVNIGKYVTPSDISCEIVNPKDIHLALTVFEKDINSLAIGQTLMAYTNTNPEKKYPCKIILIGQDFSGDRSTEIHCHFLNYDKTLLPGMYMNAEIELNNTKGNALPSDAIVNFENKSYIFIETNDNTFKMTEVNTRASENGFSQITNAQGLMDKQIAVKGAYTLLMKLKNSEE